MLRNPLDTAYITELIATFASYMMAAFVFLYDYFTFYTFLISIVFMKVISVILFAVSLMKLEEANGAKLLITYFTFGWIEFNINYTFAILFWA